MSTGAVAKSTYNELFKEISRLRNDVVKHSISSGLYRQLSDCFKCSICHDVPMSKPATYASC